MELSDDELEAIVDRLTERLDIEFSGIRVLLPGDIFDLHLEGQHVWTFLITKATIAIGANRRGKIWELVEK